jgi:hypothetical protein
LAKVKRARASGLFLDCRLGLIGLPFMAGDFPCQQGKRTLMIGERLAEDIAGRRGVGAGFALSSAQPK